jgi:hypothetical protein
MLAGSYALAAALSLSAAVLLSDVALLVPLGLVAPMAIVQIAYDASNRSRDLFPELSGSAALSSVAAAIGIAGGMPLLAAFGLSGIILARTLPSILYVRRLLGKMPGWPALVLHAVAIAGVALYASPFAVAAMALLLARAVWGMTRPAPRPQTIGWREVGFGAITVLLASVGY